MQLGYFHTDRDVFRHLEGKPGCPRSVDLRLGRRHIQSGRSLRRYFHLFSKAGGREVERGGGREVER